MSSIPSVVFQGQSKYSSDFQQVLNRAVAIASLPLQLLQNAESTMTAQQSALSGLSTTFGALQSTLTSMGSAATSVSASVSDTSSIQASASADALPGTYSIQVTGMGSHTTTISSAGVPPVTDASSGNISLSSSYTLTLNGTPNTVIPSGSSLISLAAAINDAALGVQATVVNVGSNASPDYRLSLTGNKLAADTIQLNDGNADLMTTLSTGANATYQVNGLPASLSSDSPQVTLAPGLTVTMLKQTASPVTVTLAQSSDSLNNSLGNFADAYNAAVDALGKQHGQNAGALSGQSLILSLGQALSSVTQYTPGTGSLTTLADIGLNLDSTGHLTFDPSVLSSQSTSAVQQFLGSTTTGGFLQTAFNALNSITDSTNGMLHTGITTLQDQINHQNDLISAEQDRINTMSTNLLQQLSAADATIAVLQSQVTYMSNLFATMYPNVSATSTNGGSGINGG